MGKRALVVFLSMLMVFGSAFAGMGSVAFAGAWQLNGPVSDGWTTVYSINDQNDYLHDQQTGSGSVSQDIVGSSTYASTYMHLTATDVSFRIRINSIDGSSPYQFKNFAFVGIDSDLSGSIDFFLGVYNPTGSTGRVGIYNADPGCANVSPSTTGISVKPLNAFQPKADVNYSITQATDGSNFDGNADYFVSFQLSVADISAALAGTGHSFSPSTPFRFITGTAAQDNSFNQDINGMDRNGWSSGKTWSSLGVVSNTVSPDGTVTKYAVTFDQNTGDNEPTPAVFEVSTDFALGSNFPSNQSSLTKRGGYTFQGWNTSSDGTGVTLTASTLVTQDITAYAIWGIGQRYNVTFDPTGGTINGSASTVTVQTMNGVVGSAMPTNPVKAGSNFIGWSPTTSVTTQTDMFDGYTTVAATTTVYAIWSASTKQPVTFYNASTTVSVIYPNGQSGNYGNAPTISKPGYTLSGWSSTQGGSVVFTPGQKMNKAPTSPFNYYAVWAPVVTSFIVSFNSNTVDSVSGMPSSPRTVTNGLFGALPTSPTRAGYLFVEWNKVSNGSGEAMYPNTMVGSTFTVYAIWQAVSNVNFHSNIQPTASETVQTIPAVSGVLNYMPQPPGWDSNHTFMGWGTTPSATSNVSIGNVNGVADLYAVWNAIYQVTFDPNGGDWTGSSTPISVPTAGGGVLYLPDAPTRTGCSFAGWKDASGAVFTTSTSVGADKTVYANWTWDGHTAISSAVTLDHNDGLGGSDSITATCGSSMPAGPVAPTRIGYIFTGYYDALTGGAQYYAADMSSAKNWDKTDAAVTLYAHWTAATTTVTLDDNEGAGGSGTVTATYGQTMPSAVQPTRTDYTFNGYYDDPTGGTQYYAANMSSTRTWDKTAATATLYAHWTEGLSTTILTLDDNGGTGGSGSVTATYGQAMPSALKPTRTGYAFAGYYDALTGGTQYYDADMNSVKNWDITAATATLYAHWAAATTTVTLDDNGGTGGSGSVTAVYEQAMPSADKPTRSGYAFAGYYDAQTGGTQYYDADMDSVKNWDITAATATLYAHWTAAATSVTLDDNGGDGGSGSVTATYGQAMPSADKPTRSGYVFAGYYDAQTGGTQYYDADMDSAKNWDKIDATATLYAHWTAATTTVTLDDNGGTGGSGSVTTAYDQAMPSADKPTRTGYAFVGYYDAQTGGTQYYDADMDSVKNWDITAATATLYAHWTADTTTVTLNDNEGAGGSGSVTATYGQAMPSALKPTRTGYAFAGYYDAQTGGTQYYNADMDSVKNWDKTDTTATLYAHWSAATTIVTLDDNGGAGGSGSVTATYGQAMPSALKPTRTGYAFAGYYDALTGGTQYYDADMDSVKNWDKTDATATLYAHWSAATTIVTLDDNEGAGGSGSVTATYGQAMPSALKPTRTGYAFAGYYDALTGGTQYYESDLDSVRNWDITAATATLYAHWTARTYTVTFDANGGQYADSSTTRDVTQTYDDHYVLPGTNPTRSGFTFASWNTASGGGGDTISASVVVNITANKTFYAVWTPLGDVTISYASNNTRYGTVNPAHESLNPETGAAVGALATAKAGYHFVKWQDALGNTAGTAAAFVPAKSGGSYSPDTYTAIFAPNADTAYTVRHYVMATDGTYPATPTKVESKAGMTDATVTLADLTDHSLIAAGRIGYDHGAVGNAVTAAVCIQGDGSLVVKLYYARSQYSLTLHPGTGTSGATGGGTYYVGQSVSAHATVAGGYSWIKWESSQPALLADQAEQSAAFLMPAGNVTLTSKALVKTYHINYSLDGGTVSPANPATYTVENNAFTLENPTKTGFEFLGWTGTGLTEATKTVTVTKGSTGNRNYVATWAAKRSAVTLNDNGGTGGSGSVVAEYGQPLPSAKKPKYDTYTFGGYYDSLSAGKQYYDAGMGSVGNWDKQDDTVTLYARWTGHDVKGTIVDDATPAKILPGATIIVVKGHTQYGNTATADSNGRFTITNVPSGVFNLIVTIGDKTEIIALVVRAETPVTQAGTIIFPLGNASSKLNLKGDDTPPIVVGNLHPEAEDYFADQGSRGFVKAEMVIQRTDEAAAEAVGATGTLTAIHAIDSQAQQAGVTIGLYLDMVIEKFKRAAESAPWSFSGNITKTKGLIEVVIPIPVELQGKASYVVIRHHGNAVNIIGTMPNADGEYLTLDRSTWTLTLYVRNFSVYAIGYSPQSVHTITAKAGRGGSISPKDVSIVNDGDSKTYTFQANSGYRIASVKVDGVSTEATASYTFSNVVKDHTISVTFSPIGQEENPDTGDHTPDFPYPLVISLAILFAATAGVAIRRIRLRDR